MKNRRLNVLFIAIIALAAAPQAMHDAHRLVNAAQERAESEFWSIFLSYSSPEAGEAKSSGKTELVAARNKQQEACPTERVVLQQAEASRDAQTGETRARAKAESRRTSAQETQGRTEIVEANDSDELASVADVRPVVVFSEKEEKALKAAGLHARDIEKAASRANVASLVPGSEMPMKLKQMSDMDKLLRQRTRIKERGESLYEIQTPNTVGSM